MTRQHCDRCDAVIVTTLNDQSVYVHNPDSSKMPFDIRISAPGCSVQADICKNCRRTILTKAIEDLH